MSRVNSFLFCVKLESFGLFLGWFEYGMSIFVAAGSVIGTAFVLKDAVTSESVVRGLTAVVTLLIILILCIFVASMSKELIKGIKTRDSEGVKVFRNFCTFNTLLAGFSVMLMLPGTGDIMDLRDKIFLLTSWMNFLLQAYIFLCIHSLVLKLDEQRFPSLIRHNSNNLSREFDDDET